MDYSSIEVNNRKDLTEFIRLLHADFKRNGNNNLELFLEALKRYSEDIDGYYKNVEPDINREKATWKLFAYLLRGAIVYE